ncbi:MAG: hypothetical protein OEY94_10375 [Alphaproteobacteria bacterium]|nr:hypothetical protein [Alphaproteobacteria bacterium]
MGVDIYAFLRAIAAILGVILTCIGVSLLIYLAYYVTQALQEPNSIPIVEYFLKTVKINDNAFSGNLTTPDFQGKQIDFNIQWSESVRLVVFSIVVIGIFSVIGRLSHICISGGTSLLKVALGNKGQQNKTTNKV